MTYVKTVYGHKSHRLPDISKYHEESSAYQFINLCLKWGIDIFSCEEVDEEEAEELLMCGEAETMD